MSDTFWIAVFACIPATISAIATLNSTKRNGKALKEIRGTQQDIQQSVKTMKETQENGTTLTHNLKKYE